jgi:hypothetical protein
MPAISHDLLFVGNGKLKRWQRDGQVVTLLDGDVVDYSLSADGKRAVVAQLVASTEISNTVTAVTETLHTYQLSYVNLENGSTQVLLSDIHSKYEQLDFQLSQDGKHVVTGGLGFGDPKSFVWDEETGMKLYLQETESGQSPGVLYDCVGVCQGFVWHQDNNFFVFGDDAGLFLYNLAATKPELLLASEAGLAFRPVSWARNGSWLLTWFTWQKNGIEGATEAIFDVPSKLIMTIPHSQYEPGSYFPQLTWMADDRLFQTRLEGVNVGPVLGETYRIDLNAGQVLLDEQVVLTAQTMQPLAPIHWENGRFGYGLFERNHPENGLYQRTAFNELAERVSDLPTGMPSEIVWALDGSGAVMQFGGVIYAPVGGELVDLKTAVGLTGHNFTWLP